MRHLTLPVLGLALVASFTTVASSDTAANEAMLKAIEARQAQMQLYAFNLGQLGAMAKGETPYDVGLASAAAGNLAQLSNLNGAAVWPMGSDIDSLGKDVTTALPAIWQSGSDVGAKAAALREAAAAMQTAAGESLEALQGFYQRRFALPRLPHARLLLLRRHLIRFARWQGGLLLHLCQGCRCRNRWAKQLRR